jgi:N4-(beta-N-acetylglucosaminyl)-L-asparaginase
MFSRRRFLQASAFSSLAFLTKSAAAGSVEACTKNNPVVVSTWAQNAKANGEAWKILGTGGRALDAVEAGVQVPEGDARDKSVGLGGLPDRDGKVTLDACIMNERGECGAVFFLEGILHPVKLARLVMEKTPHVQLAGEGALQFALANGFKEENLLTPDSEKVWRKWRQKPNYNPRYIDKLLEESSRSQEIPGQQDNHDTIGMIAMDDAGNLSGACSTSGMAFKMRGRVGDSPVIGAGLFIDNNVGAATATGVGEEVVRICGAHTVIELMRQGYSPQDACKAAVARIVKRNGSKARNVQVGFIALNNKGVHGGYSVVKGFTYAVKSGTEEKIYKAKSWFA